MVNFISNINEYPDISTLVPFVTRGRIKRSRYENATYGGEFIDDLIRTKDQPFSSSELNEDESLCN